MKKDTKISMNPTQKMKKLFFIIPKIYHLVGMARCVVILNIVQLFPTLGGSKGGDRHSHPTPPFPVYNNLGWKCCPL